MISVIVPIYNVSKYLDDCLSSIEKQSVLDWECILVDDGSKDNSGEICDQWALKDSRIRVIHQHNQGVSVARNQGIKVAKGEYVCFIDSDDWVDTDYLKHLIDNLLDADIVVSGLVQEFSDGNRLSLVPHSTTSFFLDRGGLEEFVGLNRMYLLYGPVQKIYRKKILDQYDIHFPVDCAYGEDLQFNYAYLEHVSKISQVAESDYHYRIVGSGTLSSKLRSNQFFQDYEQWQLLQQFYVRHDLWTESAKEMLYTRLWGTVYDGLFLYPKLKDKGFSYIQKVLAIPEIDGLKPYEFSCALWIKHAILGRQAWVFYLFFLFKK